MNISEINKEILKIWESHKNLQNGRMPLFYGEQTKNCLLFIGMNPSFSERGISAIAKKSKKSHINKEYFKYPNSEFLIEDSIEFDEAAKKHYPYFNKFKDLATTSKMEWEHIDLFFLRETLQKDALKRLLLKGKLNSYGKSQIELSKRLIDYAKPKIIIVANAKASEIFKAEYKSKFSEESGVYFTKINGIETPTIFTSMLTGQRALDNFSYEMLKWNLKRLMQNNSLK